VSSQPDAERIDGSELAQYRHTLELRVRYGDIDTLGHVNNKSYISYLEDSRIDYYRRVLSLDLARLRLGTVVRKMEIEYIRPVFLTDAVRVYVRCSRIGGKSADFEAVIARIDHSGFESIAARSISTLVSVDPDTGTPREWSESVIRAIESFEAVPPIRSRRRSPAEGGPAIGGRAGRGT